MMKKQSFVLGLLFIFAFNLGKISMTTNSTEASNSGTSSDSIMSTDSKTSLNSATSMNPRNSLSTEVKFSNPHPRTTMTVKKTQDSTKILSPTINKPEKCVTDSSTTLNPTFNAFFLFLCGIFTPVYVFRLK